MDERTANGGLSRRAVMKKALTTSAYAAPVILSATVPAGVAAATPPPPPATADLAVTKTVIPAVPVVGTNATFTVTVTNNGPAAAAGVVVNDPLPAGLTFVSATPSLGTFAGGVWTIGALVAGQTATLTLVATATGPAGTARTNTATVTSGTADPNLGNNSASVVVTPQAAPAADIAVTKTVDDATPLVEQTITFTATVRNNGPSTATGVVVSDPIPPPPGLALVTVTPSIGTYNSATGVWTIGALAVAQVATLTMTGIIGVTPVTNTATVTVSSPPDPVAANNSASATATPIFLA